MTLRDALQDLLSAPNASDGQLRQRALALLAGDVAPVSGAEVDLGRLSRCGFAEVVYAPHKSAQTLCEIFLAQQQVGQSSLATRVDAAQAAALLQAFPQASYAPLARTVRLAGTIPPRAVPGHVAIVTAGTGDQAVAEEARETLAWMGIGHKWVTDVGVAGPQRLLAQLDVLQSAPVLIVIAGMEGALPSMVAGWVAAPVIAVPTSVGYGANFAGLSALLSMLNSCAANVCVVNIDAGFKAAYLAGTMLTHRVPSNDKG